MWAVHAQNALFKLEGFLQNTSICIVIYIFHNLVFFFWPCAYGTSMPYKFVPQNARLF